MKTVCAWCGVIVKEGPEEFISHGICERCREKVLAQITSEEGLRVVRFRSQVLKTNKETDR